MKTKKLLALTLVVALLAALLAACSGGDPAIKAAVGSYVGEYTKFVGDGDDAKDSSAPFSLDLTEDGKGTHHRDDLHIPITWKLEGEKITVTETFLGIELEYTGTLKDGKLDLFNGDPSDIWTCEYVYHKQ